MKNIAKTILFSFVILLTWCSTSHMTRINFGNLDFKFKSEKSYTIKDIDRTVYPGIVIYQESLDKTKDIFINSLIITSQNDPSIKIKDFVNNNIENLKVNILWLTVKSTQIQSFACSGEKIIWIIKDFKITETNKTSYFSEFFFMYDNKWYIISFESDNQNDNSDFKNSLSNLSCTK